MDPECVCACVCVCVCVHACVCVCMYVCVDKCAECMVCRVSYGKSFKLHTGIDASGNDI